MKQCYKKVGAVVNIAGGVQVVKVYVVNHFPETTKMVGSTRLMQRLAVLVLTLFGVLGVMQSFFP